MPTPTDCVTVITFPANEAGARGAFDAADVLAKKEWHGLKGFRL